MSFSERDFSQRFQVMGDPAEEVYEAVRPLGKTIRFGLRRPKNISVRRMPFGVRHAPDFYAEAGYLVEVVGCGRDGICKSMKVDKYKALKIWQRTAKALGLLGVVLFVWNSATSEYLILPWQSIVSLVAKSKRVHGVQKFKNDGNEYHPIEWDWMKEEVPWVGTWSAD